MLPPDRCRRWGMWTSYVISIDTEALPTKRAGAAA